MTANTPPAPPLHYRSVLWRGLMLLWALLVLCTPRVAYARVYELPAAMGGFSPFQCTLLVGTTYHCTSDITLRPGDFVTSTIPGLTLISNNVTIPAISVIGSSDSPINLIANTTISLANFSNTAVHGNITANTIEMGAFARVYGNCSSSACTGSCDATKTLPQNCNSTSARGSPPSLSALTATNTSPNDLILKAKVSSKDSATTVLFYYSAKFESFCPTLLAGNAVDAEVQCSLSGLSCNTTYTWNARAFNRNGMTTLFPNWARTAACGSPSVTTGNTTDISTTGATLDATVSSNGYATDASFGYSTTDGSYITTCGATSLQYDAVNSKISCTLTNLRCGTTYYWQPSAKNSQGTAKGNPASFTTSDCSTTSKFDAYETSISNSEAATPAKRVIQTRVASSKDLCKNDGTTCAIRIAAFDTNNTVTTSYAGTVSAQLEYCTNVSRATDNSPSCGGTWSSIGAVQTVTLASGVGSAKFSAIDNAYEIVRVTISSETIKNGPWKSTDHFAIRPASLTLSASDDTNSTAGTTRSLTIGDSARTQDYTHIAGKSFTLSVSSGKSRYAANQSNAGTGKGPIVSALTTTLANTTAINGILTLGTWTSSGGTLTSTTASYDEAGSFQVALEDRDFAAIDAGDGSTETDRYFSGKATFGRFTPAKFLVSDASDKTNPASITAAHTSGTAFTYFGQDGFTATFTLKPVNAAGATTKNYPLTDPGSALNAWSALGLSASTLPAGSLLSASATAPSLTWTNGVASVSVRSQVSRPTALTQQTSLNITARPKDSDEITTDAAVILGTTILRFGRLRLLPAYGSDLLPVRVPVRAEYYTNNGWTLNVDDSATPISAGSLAIKPIVSKLSSLAFSTPPSGIAGSPSLNLTQGVTELVITPNTRGVGGAYITLNLGAGYSGATIGCRPTWADTIGGATPSPSLMHLAGNTCGTAVNTLAPAALVKFGAPKAPFNYLRERY